MFTSDFIKKDIFEQGVRTNLGRDLQLPQSVALAQCRFYFSEIYQMWVDGFSIEYTVSCLSMWVLENAKSDEDLRWYLQDRLAG